MSQKRILLMSIYKNVNGVINDCEIMNSRIKRESYPMEKKVRKGIE